MKFILIYNFKRLNYIQVTMNKATLGNHRPGEKINLEIHMKYSLENQVEQLVE